MPKPMDDDIKLNEDTEMETSEDVDSSVTVEIWAGQTTLEEHRQAYVPVGEGERSRGFATMVVLIGSEQCESRS
jgi:hypothetical protein